jgi:hypothetical protein
VLFFPFLNCIEQAHNKPYCPFSGGSGGSGGGGGGGGDEDKTMIIDSQLKVKANMWASI